MTPCKKEKEKMPQRPPKKGGIKKKIAVLNKKQNLATQAVIQKSKMVKRGGRTIQPKKNIALEAFNLHKKLTSEHIKGTEQATNSASRKGSKGIRLSTK